MRLFSNVSKERSVEVPRPVQYAPKDIVVDSEYEQLAAQVGFYPSILEQREEEIRREKFLAFLNSQHILVYPLKDVRNFLDAEVKRLNRDILDPFDKLKWSWVNLRNYSEPVPISTLQIIKRILDNYVGSYCDTKDLDSARHYNHSKFDFFVSHYHVQKPDPFLMVEFGSMQFVIDHWDEPMFRKTT